LAVDVRFVRAVVLPERLRAEVDACRFRLAVPVRGRAALFGARVAMVLTITSANVFIA
jgi:hypothetical protein